MLYARRNIPEKPYSANNADTAIAAIAITIELSAAQNRLLMPLIIPQRNARQLVAEAKWTNKAKAARMRRLPLNQVLWRYVMRPFARSYGEISTVTLSPIAILMKNFLILPEMWARISWPFSRRTVYMVAGRTLTTVPVTSIALSSALAIL